MITQYLPLLKRYCNLCMHAIEIKAVVDLDHLWSFTKLNFWQDTVRKNVSPQDYLENLEHDLDSYFIFETGKELAYTLLKERKEEVGSLQSMKLLEYEHQAR